MMTAEEIRWLKSTANELNNLLLQIYGYANRSQQLVQWNPLVREYLTNIIQTVDRASRVSQEILEHLYRADILATRSGRLITPLLPTAAPPVERPPQVAPSYFPAVAAAPKVEQGTGEFAISNPEGPGELILAVDDEPQVLQMLEWMLVEAGYRVILAKDGFQAITCYKKLSKQIGLVLLDYGLPILDGHEVFAELRAINPNAVVMLSSGFVEKNKVTQMLANGLRGFIPKPYTQDKLLQQVRSALDTKVRG